MTDLTLLGNASKLPQRPEDAALETFPNRTPLRDYWIHLDYPTPAHRLRAFVLDVCITLAHRICSRKCPSGTS